MTFSGHLTWEIDPTLNNIFDGHFFENIHIKLCSSHFIDWISSPLSFKSKEAESWGMFFFFERNKLNTAVNSPSAYQANCLLSVYMYSVFYHYWLKRFPWRQSITFSTLPGFTILGISSVTYSSRCRQFKQSQSGYRCSRSNDKLNFLLTSCTCVAVKKDSFSHFLNLLLSLSFLLIISVLSKTKIWTQHTKVWQWKSQKRKKFNNIRQGITVSASMKFNARFHDAYATQDSRSDWESVFCNFTTHWIWF